jgi:hypothetical protein
MLENQAEMQLNETTLDSLLRFQPSSYWSGEKLWRRVQEIKNCSTMRLSIVFSLKMLLGTGPGMTGPAQIFT